MKQNVLLWAFFLLATGLTIAQTPLSMNGRLKLVGTQLSNECGTAVQLRGISSHAIAPHKNCLKESAVKSLAQDWKSDILRLAVYTENAGETPGYTSSSTDKEFWHNWIDEMVNLTEKYGMYCMIDWHILRDNDPNTHINEAKTFFALMSSKYKDKKHVIYEICNEPNGGVSWGQIKNYANQIIPIIRANDPNNIIIVGTPEWSSRPDLAANDPISGTNIMYTFHFYAGTHTNSTYQNYFNSAVSRVPVFVTEWGTVNADGGGGVSTGNSDTWINMMNTAKVSWANWSFSDVDEGASALTPGACGTNSWTSRSTSGNYIYQKLSSADNFTQCSGAADDDKDGVPNGSDACANTPAGLPVNSSGCHDTGDSDNDGVINAKDLCASTPAGTPVNTFGCPLTQGFESNVCMGFNNKQGYARTDFSADSLANLEYWNRPRENSPVYSSSTSGGQLNVAITNADPDYATMGFSFGEKIVGTDTTLIPLDVRAHPVVKFDVSFIPTSYSANTVHFEIQLEDANGNSLSADATGNLFRYYIPLNTTRTLEADFSRGYLESFDAGTCGSLSTPCYVRDFDFSKVTKVKFWVNPGAGQPWNANVPPFNGTMKIDNFSIGYDESTVTTCTTFRDDDGDGVIEEEDLCKGTPAGAEVDENGCAQLDDDGDGVVNSVDRCPNTLENASVDEFGCSDAQLNADDDNDGIRNSLDECPNTPSNETANAEGCSYSQQDADNDGTPNGEDGCPTDPDKIAAGNCGCGTPETECTIDCHGDMNGTAYEDNCGQCVGGNTGLTACVGNPYDGTAQIIPGIIEAERYDLGGEGVGYHDSEPANQGGQFRNDGVDIENCEGSTTNFNIGYCQPGEWLQYTVDVQHSGTFQVSYRIASMAGNGAWHLELDGQELPGTAQNAVATNGWQTYTIIEASQPVTLQEGMHSLRLVIDGADSNIDFVEFETLTVTSKATPLKSEVDIYPVPARDFLTIEQKVRDFDSAVIMDARGVVVKEAVLTNNIEELLIENLAKGVYMIKLTGINRSEMIRVVIE